MEVGEIALNLNLVKFRTAPSNRFIVYEKDDRIQLILDVALCPLEAVVRRIDSSIDVKSFVLQKDL